MLYECSCGKVRDIVKPLSERKMIEKCVCGGDMKPETHAFFLTGTRDNFGIKNAFRDEKTGKEVNNWKSWEKAGYKKPLDVIKNDKVRDGIKTKLEKIKRVGRGRTLPVEALPA